MDTLKNGTYKKILLTVMALIILFFTCKMMMKSAGVGISEKKALLLMSLIIIFNSTKKSFWYVVIPMSLCYAIYSPVGLNFGAPSYGYVASVFATDFMEAREFFSQIKPADYLYPFIIMAGILIFRLLTVKYDIKLHKNKTILCLLIAFPMLNQAPAEFFRDLIESASKVKSEIVYLNNMMPENQWGKSSLVNSEFDNYILIIGESARKDYHNSYGYPVNNTPFMSSSNGMLVDGMTSGGTNTVASLRLMLTVPDKQKWEPDYSLNFIDMAKSAGLKTYWISNQSFLGKYDTPITAIARRSDYKFFLKYKNFDARYISDFKLLGEINRVVKIKSDNKKLIVIHLYGSHPDACKRIVDYQKIVNITDKKYSYINCYISSINKTDEILKKTYDYMKQAFTESGISSSMVYFSDHGLVHSETGGVVFLNQKGVSRFHYNIPLFRVDTNSTTRKTCRSFKSGLNFTNDIANWIGIRNQKLSAEYDLFNCIDDPNDYGLKKKLANIDLIDPAIDITGKQAVNAQGE